jgi:hypothetical protein
MRSTPLQSATRVSRVLGPILGLVALLAACGSSNPQPSNPQPTNTGGATNMQAPEPPENYTITGKRPSSGQCFQRGDKCAVNNDCCSLWCANGYCARREP